MRILYVTTIGSTMNFFVSLISELISQGHVVDIAANETIKEIPECFEKMGCSIYHLSCTRSPINKNNIKAYSEIKNIISDNHYDIVHCHTPIAGAITRLACKSMRKKGLKVFYTAHGFHFYKGAPLVNWLLYYPIEKYCARFTDTLITINHEDFDFAKRKLKARRLKYLPGVGIDVDKFKNTVVDRLEKRKALGVPENAFLLTSVGELNKNKNHSIVIQAIAKLSNPDIHYIIAGKGYLENELKELCVKLSVENQVHILGFRKDIDELYAVSDVVVFPSIREGLGLGAIEGMAAGLPLICSDNRGTREYCDDNNGIMCKSDSVEDFSKAIAYYYEYPDKRRSHGMRSRVKADKFSVEIVNSKLIELLR